MTKFRTKLLFALITLIIAVLIGLGLLLGQIFKNFYLDTFNSRIEKETRLLASSIEENGTPKEINPDMIKGLSDILDVRIMVLDKTGDVVHDTDTADSVVGPQQKKIVQEIQKNWDVKQKHKKLVTSGNEYRYYWYPLKNANDEMMGLLIMSAEVDALERGTQQIWFVLSISLGLALVLIIILGSRITVRYTKPIESATNVAMELAKGNYRARTYEDRLDETSMLSTSINILARNLQEMVNAQEMQQDRLTTLIENMGSALLLIDHRGFVVLTNRTFRDFFNLEESQLKKVRYHEVIHYSEVNRLVEEIFMTEERLRKQILLPYKLDRKHYEVYGAPIIGNNDVWKGIVVVFHDITELKKLEQMRKDFVANVSHELKTPITSIKGFSETLLDGAMDDPETLKSFLDIILKESDRLQSLIQDLLELSKIEKQGFQLFIEEVEVAGLIEDVFPILKEKAKPKDISLHADFESRGTAEVDSYRLKQVFINLISNAIAYTPKGGNVSVTVTEDRDKVYVQVKDNGMGISQEELPRIFERFYRVDKARSRNSGGTGLGLAIVKHIIEAHEGDIEVESELDKGTTFTVTLNKWSSSIAHGGNHGKP
ncbi:cell wall metabolism sensor histidine kinase WalK [Rossellomorea sp. SC111]|uniref:two-component system histidine kinase PnpS n=1 Tax=Rossellomorea sp. SC111 TaxID=2968985 RepID=UPI00215B2B0B|nr:cell wall metabolism sensor histidine kinase WalK [Rossellomorea sp. SC111]MCR8851068.1 cell wall metabolism sensor histidine kinase WalK [Rossellomorea sp. SC111]